MLFDMGKLSQQEKPTNFNDANIEQLFNKTKKWISKMEFIKIEQVFYKELLKQYIIKSCAANNFNKAKLLLDAVNNEIILSEKLFKSIEEHKINLSLLIEKIYLKKEAKFRKKHGVLKSEIINYISNFNCIKEQIFEIGLLILKKK
jgi:hypothetical protein